MKNAILKFLVSKLGLVLTPIIGSGIALLAAKLGAIGVVIDPDQQVAFAGWVATAIITLTQGLVLNQNADGVKEVQHVLRVPVDGVPGDVTIEGAAEAVTSPPKRLPIGGPGK